MVSDVSCHGILGESWMARAVLTLSDSSDRPLVARVPTVRSEFLRQREAISLVTCKEVQDAHIDLLEVHHPAIIVVLQRGVNPSRYSGAGECPT